MECKNDTIYVKITEIFFSIIHIHIAFSFQDDFKKFKRKIGTRVKKNFTIILKNEIKVDKNKICSLVICHISCIIKMRKGNCIVKRIIVGSLLKDLVYFRFQMHSHYIIYSI